ncbi:lipocalin-like domain-containing protein [Fibrella forsythiae]|uniref:Lipocalin-like domain-containing protein n=1 Tax=Fibrella forsythiae TaxID=2817061 RepID=A0ABS3JRE8_9BACT|nr:lipocalin family protein [Fibrella forsythiae]MBO0952572.1 hypothetical protein [Fibrella forsythiae]
MTRVCNLRLCAALFGMIALTTSCKKDSDVVTPDPTEPSIVASFMNVRFQMAAFELTPPMDLDEDGKPDSDLMRFMRPCDLDNTIVFEKTGKMLGDFGKQRCDDDVDPNPSKPDTWTYDNGTKRLRIIDGESKEVSEMDVVEASAKTMKVKMTMTEDGHTMTALLTWKAV